MGVLKALTGTSNANVVEDALNLAGLLNVLDGVVDSPGRILIMTTNHPDLLDPGTLSMPRCALALIAYFVLS